MACPPRDRPARPEGLEGDRMFAWRSRMRKRGASWRRCRRS